MCVLITEADSTDGASVCISVFVLCAECLSLYASVHSVCNYWIVCMCEHNTVHAYLLKEM